MQKCYWLHPVLESVFRRAFLPPLMVPFAPRASSFTGAPRLPRGVTLLELVVVLALLGGMAALVMPAMIAPERRIDSVEAIIRSARSAAIARAQPLVLAVSESGVWSLRPLPPDDAQAVGEGKSPAPPPNAFRLQFSPLGACIPLTPLPASLGEWDVASCTSAAGRARRHDGATGA